MKRRGWPTLVVSHQSVDEVILTTNIVTQANLTNNSVFPVFDVAREDRFV